MNPILAIGQILLSIALIAAILLQARGTGLSGTFGGDSAVYRSRRGIERRLWQFTIVLLVLFIVFALVAFIARRPRSPTGDIGARPPPAVARRTCRSPAATTRSSPPSSCRSSSSVASSPCRRPRRRPPPSPRPEPTLPPPATYREGVVGHPEAVMPVLARTRAERTLVGLIFSGLVRLGPDNTYEPDLAESWTTDAEGTTWTFTLRDDARLAGRRAGDGRRRRVHRRGAQGPRRRRAPWPAPGRTSPRPPSTPGPSSWRLATPIAGFLAAATQPLLPAHLLSDVPFADLATSAVRDVAGRQRPVSADRARRRAGRAPPGRAARAGGDGGPGRTDAAPVPTRSGRRPRPPPRPRPCRTSSGIEMHFYDDETAAADAFGAGEVDAVAGLCPPPRPRSPRDPAVDRDPLPDDHARDGHAQPPPRPTRSCAIPACARRCSGPWTVTRSSRRRWGATGSRRTRSSRRVVGVRRQGRRRRWRTTSRRRRSCSTTPAGRRRTAPGPRRAARPRTSSSSLTVPADGEPAAGAVAAAIADAWTDFGIKVEVVEIPPAVDLAKKLRERRVRRGRPGHRRWASSRTSIRSSPRARSAASGTNLSGYQDPALDALLETARKPGTPEARTTAWQELLTGLAARRPCCRSRGTAKACCSGGVDGPTARLIAGPGDRFWDVLAWRLAADR